jgi:hypothetical protein
MQITQLGIVLIPLSLLWAYNPVRLLQLALLSAVFEAASALTFGSFGLQPAMVPGLLFIIYIISQYALGMRYPGEGTVFRAMAPLLLLLVYAVISAWLLPDTFAGRIFVSPQKPDPLAFGALVPLEFTFGNITQVLYLGMNVLFALTAAIYVTRGSVPYERIIAGYMFGGYIVVALVFWQFANRLGGIWYPEDLLHSNPGFAIVTQSFGAVPRMQGPFSEPAALAFYLSGVALCCLWLSIRGYRLMKPNLLLALSILCVLLSTSTTGIVTLVVGLPLVLGLASVGGDLSSLKRAFRTMGVLLIGAVLVLGPLFVIKPGLIDSVDTVVTATLTKGDSDSYEARSSLDSGAIEALAASDGLGVGWGSYRSSSLIPGLLANGGVFGLVMVSWLIWGLYRLSRRARVASPTHPGQVLAAGFTASMCGQFGAALISGPMINSLAFFLQLGCVVGVLARMSIEPRLHGLRSASLPGQGMVRAGTGFSQMVS